jgi:hypothetical protein
MRPRRLPGFSTMPGALHLKTPRDLFANLGHDLEQLKQRPDDPYAAFNFFVTAEHILDWLHPAGRSIEPIRRAARDAELLLAVPTI